MRGSWPRWNVRLRLGRNPNKRCGQKKPKWPPDEPRFTPIRLADVFAVDFVGVGGLAISGLLRSAV